MGGWKAGGANVYLGVTGSGKTTKAMSDCQEDRTRWKFPVLIMDLESAADWVGVQHYKSSDEVNEALFVKRTSAIWTPETEEERVPVFRLISHWGGVCVIVDGVPMIASEHYFEPEFRKSLYRHRHGLLGPTFWYLVAQRASLMHRHVYAAVRTVFIFKQAPGVDAKRCQDEFGVPIEQTTTLERGASVPIPLGFPEEKASPNQPRPNDNPTVPEGTAAPSQAPPSVGGPLPVGGGPASP